MLVALISDIHANAEALRQVVQDARRFDPKVRFWCLGDVFGRGPSPGDVWDILCAVRPRVWLAGNWDWGLLGQIQNVEVDGHSFGDFKEGWWRSLVYQRELLSTARLDYAKMIRKLSRLPAVVSPLPGVYLAHGSFQIDRNRGAQLNCVNGYLHFDNPGSIVISWDCLQEFLAAPLDLPGVNKKTENWTLPRLLIAGHTHVQGMCWLGKLMQVEHPLLPDHWYELLPEQPVLINPGSVGFPRQNGQGYCANYALLEIKEDHAWRVCFRRVGFNQYKVLELLEKFGYSQFGYSHQLRQAMGEGCSEVDRQQFIDEYLDAEEFGR